MDCSAVVPSLIVVPAAALVVRVPREALQVSILVDAVPCTRPAVSPAAVLQVAHVPVSDSAPALEAHARDSVVRAPVWAEHPDWCRLQARLHVRSVRADSSGAVVSNTRRPKKAQ